MSLKSEFRMGITTRPVTFNQDLKALVAVDVYADENVWLRQRMMAQLYDVEVPTINYHLKKVFSDSELEEDSLSVIRNFRITAADGKTYDTKHYNLSAIIAVGYKVNSERAVQFREWAMRVIEEFTIKGFTMDDERLERSEELDLTDDELAFYDALEVNDSAVKVLGDETLRTIARELVDSVRKNVSIDWTVRESVRAKLRVIVKRILRKYGYPPDKQEAATNTVLQQAELLSEYWTAAGGT